MNAINRNGFVLGLTGTIIVWILAVILGWFIKIESPVKDYKEIRIQLSDPSPVKELPKAEEDKPLLPPKEMPAAETVEEIPVIEETAAPVKEIQTEKPVPVESPKPVEQPKTVEQPKPAAPVQKTETAKPVEKTTPSTAQIVQSVEELTKEASAKKKNAVFDESLFADEDDFNENTSQKPTPVNQNVPVSSASTFEGTAASGSETKAEDTSMTSSSQSKKTESQTSSGTRDSLDKLKDTVAVGGGKTTEEKTSVTGEGGGIKSGSVDIKWAEGKSRKLLYPAKPAIKIPARLQTLIDSTKKVQIKFTVLASGNVTITEIAITPSAVLPLEVQNEIKKQISTWLFDEDVSDGQAVFDYSIIKE